MDTTACSWCTHRWLSEKLFSWEQSKIFKDGLVDPVSLPDYLRIWERAGKRCAGGQFEINYQAAIASYQKKGLLSPKWDLEPTTEIATLLEYGPSTADYPVHDARMLRIGLQSYRTNITDLPGDITLDMLEEYISCLEGFERYVTSLDTSPFLLSFSDVTKYILSDMGTATRICTKERAKMITAFGRKLHDFCPNYKSYDIELSPVLSAIGSPFSLETFIDYKKGTLWRYQLACWQPDQPRPYAQAPCGAILAQWGKQQWRDMGSARPQRKDVIRLTRNLIEALPPVPLILDNWDLPTDRTLTLHEEKIQVHRWEWQKLMDEGVCGGCMLPYYFWGGFRLSVYDGDDLEVAMESIKTAHILVDKCTERGVSFSTTDIDLMDTMWKDHYGEELWAEAFRMGREDPGWLRI